MALNWIGLSQLCHLTKSTKHKLIWILNRHDYQFQVPKTYPLSYDAHFLPEKKIENQFFFGSSFKPWVLTVITRVWKYYSPH